jgi:phage shock protein PspC (stress-responsive transcriptional regulator)
MRLTQKQEWLIGRHLHEVARALEGDTEPMVIDRAVARVRGRIEGCLRGEGDGLLSDETVREAIRKTGQADVVAREILSQAQADAARWPESSPNRRWLGVCYWAANRSGVPPRAVRAIALLVGVLAAPVALLAYAAGYFWLLTMGSLPEAGRLRPVRLAWRIAVTLVVAAGLYLGANYAFKGLSFAMDNWAKRPVPDLGEWGWYLQEQRSLLFWTLFLTLPVALLGALPMAGGWDRTLRRVSQAMLALYAVVICFGLASVAAGIILHIVREFTG